VKRLVVATQNPGKLREVAQILADLPYEVVSLSEYPNAPDVEETGATFLENAVLKAIKCSRFTREMTLADDSGLEIDALGGAPGVRSSRFAPTDPERIAKVLELMKDVPDDKRTARFRCAIAIAWPDKRVETCEAKVEGIIAREPKGSYGFGYDPIFYIPELGKHMAELEPEEKNAISHRGRALRIMKKILLEELAEGRA
jgi:XTP/dITP diphosphohydrolase